MRIAWMLGWAVPEAWFAPIACDSLSTDTHCFFAAAPDAVARLSQAGSFDHIVGHSLGAQLLLEAAPRLTGAGAVTLLSPIFSFSAEEELGGRIHRAQVTYLARWLRRDPLAAVVDFYARAGLDIPATLAPVECVDDLAWGLERLGAVTLPPPLPPSWTGWVGADDALLDAGRLHQLDERIGVLPGATHHPAALIDAWASRLPAARHA